MQSIGNISTWEVFSSICPQTNLFEVEYCPSANFVDLYSLISFSWNHDTLMIMLSPGRI